MNPFLGRNFEAMDPLEWLARLSDHIPDPGQHRTLFYGEYSSRVRGSAKPAAEAGGEHGPRRRASPSWGRLIQVAIGKILDHLGLNSPEVAKPPPPAREVLRVAEHGDGWGVPAQWE